jgi:bifunctional enzyme CysN/CysC
VADPAQRFLNVALIGAGGASSATAAAALGLDENGTVTTAQYRVVAIDLTSERRSQIAQIVRGDIVLDAAIVVVPGDANPEPLLADAAAFLPMFGLSQALLAVVVPSGERPGRLAAPADAWRETLSRHGVSCPAAVLVNGPRHRAVLPDDEDTALADAVDGLARLPSLDDLPLRMTIGGAANDVGPGWILGHVQAGVATTGDLVVLSPSNRTARIVEMRTRGSPTTVARATEHVAVRLDEDGVGCAGEILSHPEAEPIETDVFRARILWAGRAPLQAGVTLSAALASGTVPVLVQSVDRVVDPDTGLPVASPVAGPGQLAEIVCRTRHLVALDAYRDCPATGRIRILEDGRPVAWGFLGMKGYADQRGVVTVRATNVTRVQHHVTATERIERHRHAGGVLWFTGLSGAGKSTLAINVERRLFDLGYHVYVLDGDNVRHGLNADLGFSPGDRSENIRRVGEVAALFARAGIIAISAFISPYRSDRERARRASDGSFHEIYVRAPLDICERRDPKKLYARARAGEIRDFTGISAPYEAPESPELVVDTAADDIEACVQRVVDYVARTIAFGR